jgi:hypothetical protein
MNRQRQRHDSRKPLEQILEELITPTVGALGSTYIEVQDHDEIHGVLVQVEVRPAVAMQEVANANKAVRELLVLLASKNLHPCMNSWSACFTRDGRTIATSWPKGIQGP